MALVKCPECGREKVSDKAVQCPDCGYPIAQHFSGIESNKKTSQDSLNENNRISDSKKGDYTHDKEMLDKLWAEYKMKSDHDLAMIKENSNVKSVEYRYATAILKSRYPSKHKKSNNEKDDDKVKCPKCKSTQISTGARGVSFFRGFVGSGATVNRCAKCGYTWKP